MWSSPSVEESGQSGKAWLISRRSCENIDDLCVDGRRIVYIHWQSVVRVRLLEWKSPAKRKNNPIVVSYYTATGVGLHVLEKNSLGRGNGVSKVKKKCKKLLTAKK